MDLIGTTPVPANPPGDRRPVGLAVGERGDCSCRRRDREVVGPDRGSPGSSVPSPVSARVPGQKGSSSCPFLGPGPVISRFLFSTLTPHFLSVPPFTFTPTGAGRPEGPSFTLPESRTPSFTLQGRRRPAKKQSPSSSRGVRTSGEPQGLTVDLTGQDSDRSVPDSVLTTECTKKDTTEARETLSVFGVFSRDPGRGTEGVDGHTGGTT